MSGTDFELAARYGQFLNVTAIAFVFASAMPLLLPVIAMAAGAIYWVQLAELLHVSRRPAQQVHTLSTPPCLPDVSAFCGWVCYSASAVLRSRLHHDRAHQVT
jgi:hypothetical protein